MSSLQLIRSTNLSNATDEQLGSSLTALYHDAQAAEMAFLRFGAAFHAVEELVSGTRAGNSPERGPGSYGFESWLRDHAPDVSPRTARRYRDIARATAEKFRIENPMDVFTLPVEELSEADRAKRAKALEFVSDKSMRGIQLELGLTTPKAKGPASARLSEAEKHDAFVKAARARSIQCFSELHELEDRWQLMTDDQIRQAMEDMQAMAKAMRGWLELVPAARLGFDAAKYLRETAA